MAVLLLFEFSGVKTNYRELRPIADRRPGGKRGVFPTDAAFAAGCAA